VPTRFHWGARIPQSRRRRPRIGPRSAAVPCRLRRCLDDGGRDVETAAFAAVSTSAAKIRRGLDVGGRDQQQWPAAFAMASTPEAEDLLFSRPPLPRSRRRRPRSAAMPRGLDAGWPAGPPSQPCLSEVLKRAPRHGGVGLLFCLWAAELAATARPINGRRQLCIVYLHDSKSPPLPPAPLTPRYASLRKL
jgi:hypothetical protein